MRGVVFSDSFKFDRFELVDLFQIKQWCSAIDKGDMPQEVVEFVDTWRQHKAESEKNETKQQQSSPPQQQHLHPLQSQQQPQQQQQPLQPLVIKMEDET